ncbi:MULTISPECIES: thioredoxin [Paenibacillus]|uniref:Thioredoxin n=1 Tax=Paenibacillus polymyxa TaxID=1406 RepID=A0A378XZS3_PAEPO|nr:MULTISPECIES: thioredoxin [Paenibacillus]KAF6580449.1 thioredoxin [Paenibacillus sp. EKM211P]MBE7899661.1 thioredoxin [Paenibacillus polymyxa]MBG9765147.1 thioredoxin [Paenibacillus polymyxa]MCC3259321.1 thioredoxin [Paenibacillus polymyxa]QPK55223.1 thioredoxin [Paenibacillus polymyxa]
MGATTLTKNTFSNQIQSGVTLVDFWAPWCGPCKIQLPIVEELADELKGQATLAKVNVDEETELASQFGIRSIPTLLLFKDGKLVDTMVGVNQKNVLKDKILKLAN